MTPQYDQATLERLLFRRQFILGPDHVARLPTWQNIDLSATLKLTVHPELEVQRVRRGDKWVALLGYVLDPLNPRSGNLDIIDRLLADLDTCDSLPDATDRLGGRWIVIASDSVRTVMFADAVGMRQIFYRGGDPTWCASQPGLLAEVLNLPADAGALAFTQTDRYAGDKHASTWYPGDRSPYKDTKLLLPNHYLDLGSGQPHRYWPRRDLDPIPFQEGANICLQMLQGLMDSARHRFKMSLAMTAGWDSRLVLAATRAISPDVFYFTGLFWNMDEAHMDAASPSRLLSRLGLKNHLIPCRNEPDSTFRGLFKRNVVMAHDAYGAVAMGLFEGCPPDRVCAKGDVAEIAKCYFRFQKAAGAETTAHDLAKLSEMDPHPFVIKAFEEWLADARPRNVHLLDLFCWEQAMGSMEAMVEAECDIAQEAFSPLNCRALLVTMLRVAEKYRRAPTFELFRVLIERMWPEVLDEPINAQTQIGARALVRRAIARTGMAKWVPVSMRHLGKKWLS